MINIACNLFAAGATAAYTPAANFAYCIVVCWWMFVLSDIVAIVIALFTISSQVKDAKFNPVKSLRSA